jgi:hypothetical protein
VSGEAVTATATVVINTPGTDSAAQPSGTLTFQQSLDGGGTWTAIPGCNATTPDWNSVSHSGSGTCTTAYTTAMSGVKARTIYSGDVNFAGSTSTAVGLNVGKDATITSVVSSAQSSTPSAAVTFTVLVDPVAPGAGTPTGTVTFTDGSKTLCTAMPLIAARTTCTAHLPVQPFTQTVTATYSGDSEFVSSSAHTSQAVQHGYWLVASDGGIFNFGDAKFYGSTGGIKLNQPMVGISATSDGRGYWTVASDGGVFTFGDAHFYGSTGNIRLNKPVIAMTSTSDGKGYYMVASDGGVFTFGDAHFYGSTGAVHLAAPIVGMVLSPDGKGYYLVGADGGVFAFGDAKFHGSIAGSIPAGVKIVGLAPTSNVGGYWLALSNGRVLAFGNAFPYGSVSHPAKPIVAIAATNDGSGYWTVGADGGIFTFGDAFFDGSTGGQRLAAPIVDMTDI